MSQAQTTTAGSRELAQRRRRSRTAGGAAASGSISDRAVERRQRRVRLGDHDRLEAAGARPRRGRARSAGARPAGAVALAPPSRLPAPPARTAAVAMSLSSLYERTRATARRARPRRSATCASRSPIAAASAAATACPPRGCTGSSARELLSFEEIERLVARARRDGRPRRAPDRRRAARAPRAAAPGGDARGDPRAARARADHQRLPARARRRGARRGRRQPLQRLGRLAPARALHAR